MTALTQDRWRWMHDRWLLAMDMSAKQQHYSCRWKIYYTTGHALQASNVGSWQLCTLPMVRLSNTVSVIYLVIGPTVGLRTHSLSPLATKITSSTEENTQTVRPSNSHSNQSAWTRTCKQKSRIDTYLQVFINPHLPHSWRTSSSPFLTETPPPPPPWLAPLLQEILSFLPQTGFLGWLQSLLTKCLEECNGNRKIMFWFL